MRHEDESFVLFFKCDLFLDALLFFFLSSQLYFSFNLCLTLLYQNKASSEIVCSVSIGHINTLISQHLFFLRT